ncbi:probable cation-transporting ATPase 13A4 isoform X2 [Hemicordylus capensis]|uniref:probable cation-transporting ATPase 13A4 isoform X2 n=1 Tax=Hemicordylus capensis TaxID=884348 RepID=UPI00230432ED|nr:probable cation-transporting ATPase 13A4 isoform X2 [Hemicordylus capensis]
MGRRDHGGSHRSLLSEGEETEMEMFGYKTHRFWRALCIAGYIMSCGALLLVFYWKPAWGVWAKCVPCDLQEADVVLLRTTDEFRVYSQKKVTWISLSALSQFSPEGPSVAGHGSLLNKVIMKPELRVRCLQVQNIRYAWDFCAKRFQKVGVLEDSHSCAEIHARFGSGLTSKEQDVRRAICGPNAITVEVPPVWKLLVKEVLNPFYVFQAFSVCLWFTEDYIEYSVAIIVMSLLSVSLTVYDLRKQSLRLHRLVESHQSVLVKVCRKPSGFQELESCLLVPGDTLVLEGGRSTVPCDAILISGQCIVNEAMLTGESIPVTKTSLPCDAGSGSDPWPTSCAEDPRRHLLFCGTEVVQAKGGGRGPAKAVVLRTGFNTAKGDLVRSILYPKPMNFRLYRDAIRFLMCLIGVAAVGMVYAVCVFTLSGEKAGEVVKKALDVITIAVPPALPAALTTGIIYTQRRLKRKGIFCISPQRINVCGQLNVICFDKEIEDSDGPERKDGELADAVIVKPGAKAGQVAGRGVAILCQFPFSSALQRMSVIAQELSGERHVFMKGAPEKVADFCRPETVPHSFSHELQLYASRGFRVIGLAHKALPAGTRVASLTRAEAESSLTFLGFLIMENRLKSETRPVLEELRAARIRSVMVTGDNIQTAVAVARKAGMMAPGSQAILVEADTQAGPPSASISWHLLEEEEEEEEGGKANGDSGPEGNCTNFGGGAAAAAPGDDAGLGHFHFCMSGRSYEVITEHFNHLLPKLLLNGTVFARMSPAQKASLVQELQRMDYFVGMCGDGANDCGALKVAHAGISLSEQEASVASPFTSKTPNIRCVPELLRQGRAALVTSFCMFKFMALYSTIQYVGVLLLYWQLSAFGNYQFLFQDLAITTVIGMTMSLNGASPKLAPYRPPAQLVSPPLLLSMVLNLLFSLAMQVSGFVLVQKQPWYSPDSIFSACSPGNTSHTAEPLPSASATLGNATAGKNADSGYKSYENTSVWLLSTINCLTVALVFSKGRPFRQPVYKNYLFVLVLAAQLGVCLFFLFANIDGLYAQMDLVCTPGTWRITLLVMLLVTFAVSFLAEEAVVENRALWTLLKKAFGYQSRSGYKKLRRALEKDPAWPPRNRSDFSPPSVAVHVRGAKEVYSNPAFVSHEKPACCLKT